MGNGYRAGNGPGYGPLRALVADQIAALARVRALEAIVADQMDATASVRAPKGALVAAIFGPQGRGP